MSNPGSGISPSPLRRTREMRTTEGGSRLISVRFSSRQLGKLPLRRSARLLGKSAMTMPMGEQISLLKSPDEVTMPESPCKSPAEGKSAMTMPEHSQMSPCKSPDKGKSAMTEPESPRKSPAKDVIDHELTLPSSPSSSDIETEEPDIETEMILDRKHAAQRFRKNFTYDDNILEKKTCIHALGDFSWKDKSNGFTSVAVRMGILTCVVFKKTLDHVKDRLSPYLKHNDPWTTFSLFGLTTISDIEVLADLPTGPCQSVVNGKRIDSPFAIVSVDQSNNKNDPVKDEDEDAAVKYLKGILEKNKNPDLMETIAAAIHALQLLYSQKFKPEEVWVAVAFFDHYEVLRECFVKFYFDKIDNTPGYQAAMAEAWSLVDFANQFRGLDSL